MIPAEPLTARGLFEVLRMAEEALHCPAVCFAPDLRLWGFYRPDDLVVAVSPWSNLTIPNALSGFLGFRDAVDGPTRLPVTFDPITEAAWTQASTYVAQAPLRRRLADWIIEHAEPKPPGEPYWLNVVFMDGMAVERGRVWLEAHFTSQRTGRDHFRVLIANPAQWRQLQQNVEVMALTTGPIEGVEP